MHGPHPWMFYVIMKFSKHSERWCCGWRALQQLSNNCAIELGWVAWHVTLTGLRCNSNRTKCNHCNWILIQGRTPHHTGTQVFTSHNLKMIWPSSFGREILIRNIDWVGAQWPAPQASRGGWVAPVNSAPLYNKFYRENTLLDVAGFHCSQSIGVSTAALQARLPAYRLNQSHPLFINKYSVSLSHCELSEVLWYWLVLSACAGHNLCACKYQGIDMKFTTV